MKEKKFFFYFYHHKNISLILKALFFSLLSACSVVSDSVTCDPLDSSPLGSSVRGIFQARIPEWVAISYSRGSTGPRGRTSIFCNSYIWQAVSLLLCPLRIPLKGPCNINDSFGTVITAKYYWDQPGCLLRFLEIIPLFSVATEFVYHIH